jgi:pilus assembly protein CpaC
MRQELRRYREGSPDRPAENFRVKGGTKRRALLAASCCCALMAAAPVMGASFDVAVRSFDDLEEHVTVNLGMSVLLEATEPITRASIASKEIAEVTVVTPQQILVTGKGVGVTKLMLWDEAGQQRIFDVSVELPLNQLKSAIETSVPGARVQVRSVLDTIVLTGVAPSADAAQRIQDIAEVFSPKVTNHMDVAGKYEVLLRCTVAEVSKRAIRQLGVNGWIAGDNVRDMFAVNQLDQINPVNIGAGPTGNINQSGGLLFATDENGLVLTPTPTLSLGFPRVQMQLFFQALRENGLLRILAEPNLVAIAGEEASFLAGGEFPVPVPQGSSVGGTIVTIEWKEYGVRLKFTPMPMGGDKIRLRVTPEVSELDFSNGVQLQGFIVPALTQRRAETTVELASGSTIAIAGLLSDQIRAVARKIPALGDVPVLGALFSSTQYLKNETELVILVTPELVEGMNPDQVPPVPGQDLAEPNDWEWFFLQQLTGEPKPDEDIRELSVKTDVPARTRKWTAPPTDMSLHGPWGFAEERETTQKAETP